ncbi:MAG: glycoside hydrolase family 57 protein [Bacteroidales bacterium]|nr:glycoside hydrolase family 57 protein [Bacteroidales bacterium]
MKTICLYFQVHQPLRFRRYRFFDIGNDHYYYDDYSNESIMRRVADKCYLPANKLMLDLINEYGCKFKVSFSITGIALDQMELYTPDVLESFKKLAKTGCVEFLAETYSHSLVALKSKEEFEEQVKTHAAKIKKFFGQTPKVFRNTELVYSDDIGAMVADMGFEAMLTEGAKHVLGWKSPNYVYCNAINPKLKVLLKNFKLSDDIAFRFSNKGWPEYPLTAEKYATWLKNIDPKEETINLFMDYETFGEHQGRETGIFDFLKALPKQVFKKTNYEFATPSEVAQKYQPVAAINVPYPISWADAERDLSAWLGNFLQEEAYNKLYTLSDKVKRVKTPDIKKDWIYLQASDHFYYMCTKFFTDGEVHSYFNPYESPYAAFINYMNVLSDFSIRLNKALPETAKEKEIAGMASIIEEKDKLIQKYEAQLKKTKTVTTKTTKQKPSVKVKSKNTASKGVIKKAAPKAKTIDKKVITTKAATSKKSAQSKEKKQTKPKSVSTKKKATIKKK